MNILFISHRIPYPPNKGDKIRSFHEIKYLSKDHNLFLAFLIDNERDVIYLNDLKDYCVGLDYDIIKPRWQKIKSIPYLLTDKPLGVPYFYSRQLQAAVDKRLGENKIDAIICFSSPMAEYVFKSKALDVRSLRLLGQNNCSKRSIAALAQNNSNISNNSNELNIRDCPRLIMDFVDVDSDKWRIYAGFSPFPFSLIYKREWKRLMNYENKIGTTFDWSVFVSEKEIELFKSFCPEANIISIPNGVDYSYYTEVRSVRDVQDVKDVRDDQNVRNVRNDQTSGAIEQFEHLRQATRLNDSNNSNTSNIVFIGAMDYFPNEDAILYFSSDIWPHVKKELPDAKFYIVGGRPSKKVKELSEKDPHIIVTGYVPDVRSYLSMADIFVAPLRIARGLQNKVLEAMAAGVPVVARPEAVQGLSGYNGCIQVEQNDIEFALCIRNILKAPQTKQKIVHDALKFIQENHHWEENLKKWDNLLT
ncbi:MAG: glycosyltransferase [Nitrospira sp.]|nr:glycosyltransferase [Nitrospira sp.]